MPTIGEDKDMNRLWTYTKSVPGYLNIKTVSTGTVAALIACTGPILIVITAAQNGNLLPEQTVSWVFSIYFVAGLLGIILPLLFGMPIAGAYSIPAAVLMTQAITQFPFHQVVGAYVVAGLLIFFIGFAGWFQTLLTWLPTELVMAMIAGSMIHFATDMVQSVFVSPIIGLSIILTYFLFIKFARAIPPIVGALLIGIILFPFFEQSLTFPSVSFSLPSLWLPEFSFAAILAISIPITIMLLGTEGAQSISVLRNAGYEPPVNKLTMINGVSTMVTSAFGGHSACVAGIMTALCSSPEVGPKRERYVAAIVAGVWMCLFAVFALFALSFIMAIPSALIKIIAGLALMNFLLNCLQNSFSTGQFQLGAFFSMIIAMSGIQLLGIGATFWALAGGWLISWFLENQAFQTRIKASKEKLPSSA